MAKCTSAIRLELPSQLARGGHGSVSFKDRILVFGGRLGNTFFNDLWQFDTATDSWECLSLRAPFAPRANHSCTVVDHCLWVIGGSNQTDVYDDAFVFDLRTRTWSSPPLRCALCPRACLPAACVGLGGAPRLAVQVWRVQASLGSSRMLPTHSPLCAGCHRRGRMNLLKRTAHGACCYPLRKDHILLYGGYGSTQPGGDLEWLSDLVLINTVSCASQLCASLGAGVHRALCCSGPDAGCAVVSRAAPGRVGYLGKVCSATLLPARFWSLCHAPALLLALSLIACLRVQFALMPCTPRCVQLGHEVKPLEVSGTVPKGRGYHTWTAVGQRCYAVGGRTTSNRLCQDSELLAVLDVPGRKWVPPGGQGKGAGGC